MRRSKAMGSVNITGTDPYVVARGLCAIAIFTALLGSTAPSPLYSFYIEKFNLSHTTSTGIFAIYAGGTLFSLVLSAKMTGLFRDVRAIIVPGLIIAAAGALVFASAESPAFLLLGRFLNGFGTGAITGMASAALYDLAPTARKSTAATIATIAFTAGAAGGPILSSLSIYFELFPTVTPFVLIIILAAVAVAGLIFCDWQEGKAAPQPKSSRETEEEGTGEAALFALACFAIGTAWMLGSVLMAIGADLGSQLFQVKSATLAGLTPAVFQIFAGIGQMVMGKRKVHFSISLGLIGILLAQFLLVITSTGTHAFAILLLMPICGFSYGSTFVGALGMAHLSAPSQKRGAFIAFFYVVGYFLNALPAMAVGVLIDWAGLDDAFYFFSAALCATATVGIFVSIRLRNLVYAPMSP